MIILMKKTRTTAHIFNFWLSLTNEKIVITFLKMKCGSWSKTEVAWLFGICFITAKDGGNSNN